MAPNPGPSADLVTLAGQDYYVKGLVRGEVASEFEDGFKIGNATYDTREGAFFLAMDDWSGGFGHRRLDIRQDIGTFWESLVTAAPNLWRKGHATLGYQAASYEPGNPTQANMTLRNPSHMAHFMPDNSYMFGFGNKLYKTFNGSTFSVVDTVGVDAAELQSIVEYVEPNGTITHFTFWNSIAEATTGTARYRISHDNGATWANGAKNYVLHDAIYWDGKIIAAFGRSIMYATVTAGVEVWNIDDPTDGVFLAGISHGHIHFVGIAQAPWGQPAPYFTDEAGLWVLDFYTRKVYPIDTGLAGHYITASCMWNGDIMLSDGWNVVAYDPAAKSLTSRGFPRQDGVSTQLRTTTGDYQITALTPSEGMLHATVSQLSSTPNTLMFQLPAGGGGWTQIGADFAMFSHAAFQVNLRDSYLNTSRYFFQIGALANISATCLLVRYQLPGAGHIPLPGVDPFMDNGQWTTGWIDGGFFDLYGAFYRMSCDAWNLTPTETVTVEYQLDNNETMGWIQMRDLANVPAVFNDTHINLYPAAADPVKGIQFRTIRFRISLVHSASFPTRSPELRALVMVYDKQPAMRTTWKFEVDVDRMVKEHILVSGVTATYAGVLGALTAVWNTKPMSDFTIPNVKTGMRVQMAAMLPTADNIRNADVAPGPAHGSIVVTVTEAVLATPS